MFRSKFPSKKIIAAILLLLACAPLALWILGEPSGPVAYGMTLLDPYVKPPDAPAYYTLHYRTRSLYFDLWPDPADPVVFFGDSISHEGEWDKLFPGVKALNRGISGDTTLGLLRRQNEVIDLKPRTIFMLIGTNDLCFGRPVDQIAENYRMLLGRFRQELPGAKVYVQSVLPINEELHPPRKYRNNKNIAALNAAIRKVTESSGYAWIDIAPSFRDASGQLDKKLTRDGLHLSAQGYQVWQKQIVQYVK